jgi:predicted CXXCH cytochrome family protein
VDHLQVLGPCGSCHNGMVATGKNATHIPSGEVCDDCHTTAAWVPANFDHVNISGD